MSDHQNAPSYLGLLRDNRNYRQLWLAELVSFLGDWFNTVALYAAVEELSAGTWAFAAVFVAKLLPIFLVTPIAGPLIDRFDRRTLLLVTDLARAACAVGLIVAYRMQSLPALLAILVAMVALAGVFLPTRGAVLPQVVSSRELVTANGLSGGTWSAMLALGAAIGGAVTAAVGIELALAVDAITFLVSAAFVVPLPRLLPRERQAGDDADHGFVAGLRYLRRQPYLAAILALKPLLALGGGGLAMIPVFATRVFPASGAGYIGLLYAVRGLGALIGSTLLPRLVGSSPQKMRRLVAPAFLICAGAYIALALSTTIAQAALAYFATAIGGGAVWVTSSALGQHQSDNAFRGRVFSLEWGALTLIMSIAAALAGWVLETGHDVDARDIVLWTGGLFLLPTAFWGLVLVLTPARSPDRVG